MSTSPRRFFTSTQMLGIIGSTRKTLRVLEARGLIKPARSTGRRRYSQECLRRFWLIELLREVGMPLPQIAEILGTVDAAPTAGDAATKLLAILGEVRRRIDGKIRGLELARDTLATATQTLSSRCSPCARPASACGECASAGHLDLVTVLLLTKAGKITDDAAAGDK